MHVRLRPLSAAVLLASAPLAAQQAPAPTPNAGRSYTEVVRLKPEMAAEWEKLQKNEVIPALKKAGVTSRTVVRTVVGNQFEYLVFTPMPLWAEMDREAPLVRALGQQGADALRAKVRRCVLTANSYLVVRNDSLSVPSADAPIWRTTIRRGVPGKANEIGQLYANEIAPAMKKAKEMGLIAGYMFSTRGVGANSYEFSETTQYATFADMDKGDPMVNAIGNRDASTAIADKRTALAPSVTTIIRRRVADLSF